MAMVTGIRFVLIGLSAIENLPSALLPRTQDWFASLFFIVPSLPPRGKARFLAAICAAGLCPAAITQPLMTRRVSPDIALRGASGVTTEVAGGCSPSQGEIAEVFIAKELTNDFGDFVTRSVPAGNNTLFFQIMVVWA